MKQVIGRLNGDDLLCWRLLVARDNAIHLHPPHWSREEIRDHLLEIQRFRDYEHNFGWIELLKVGRATA